MLYLNYYYIIWLSSYLYNDNKEIQYLIETKPYISMSSYAELCWAWEIPTKYYLVKKQLFWMEIVETSSWDCFFSVLAIDLFTIHTTLQMCWFVSWKISQWWVKCLVVQGKAKIHLFTCLNIKDSILVPTKTIISWLKTLTVTLSCVCWGANNINTEF